ncbi:DUF4355 domain-containing protein [Peptoniphilus raoultii]|uniref:DUF4355 domain-containing protein n=1 Tax=Peptoniphilus raoultii TaxID=1776387 RepID=UPI0008D960E4|nr:DUF4355 domain-containing protein [Peptoniphilus raoultii]
MNEETKDTKVEEEVKTEAEQKEEQQEEKHEEKKYTDKEVDEIVNKKFADWKAKEEKRVNEAKKLEKMNAEEKIKYEKDKLQEELDELRAEKNKNEMIKVARGILAEENISISDNLLEVLVDQEADKTKENISNFVELFNAEVEKVVKDKLRGTTPKKGGGSKLTKEEIMKIKDSVLRQQTIAENLNLFE